MMTNQQHKPANLNLLMLTALVTGNMIGSGIYTLPATLAGFGSISILAWLLTSLGAIFLALVFAQFSAFVPKAGGPYAYCRAVFGDFVGFEIAYSYWIAIWVGNAAIAIAFTSYLAEFLPLIKSNHWLGFASKAGIVWLLTGINLLGVRNAAILQVIATFLKLIPLFLIGFIGIFYIHPEYYQAFNTTNQSNFSALQASAILTFWAFVGLESATIPAGDVINKRWIAYATILGTLITACIYILCTTAIMGLVPNSLLASSSTPFTEAAKILFPNHAAFFSSLIALGAMITCLGALNGWILLQAQIPKAAADDRLFPHFFTKENRFGAPANGLIISSLAISLLLLMTMRKNLLNQFNFIILIALLFTLLPYLITAIGEVVFSCRDKKITSLSHFRIISIAIIGAIYAGWAISGIGINIIMYGVMLLLSGIPLYIFLKPK